MHEDSSRSDVDAHHEKDTEDVVIEQKRKWGGYSAVYDEATASLTQEDAICSTTDEKRLAELKLMRLLGPSSAIRKLFACKVLKVGAPSFRQDCVKNTTLRLTRQWDRPDPRTPMTLYYRCCNLSSWRQSQRMAAL